MSLQVYLHFTKGQAKEAMQLYQKAFQAQAPHIMTFKEVPNAQVLENELSWVMHAEMDIEGIHFNISDTPSRMGYQNGNQINLMIHCETEEEIKTKFKFLSQDGEIVTPLEKTFFATLYGHLIDPFGIPWQLIYFKK